MLNIGTADFTLLGIVLQMPRALIHREGGKAVATQLSEQNPFNFSRFEGWFAGIEKRALKLGDVFGSPLFDRASAELGNGRRLVIETSNNGPHKPLYSVGDWNGKPYTKSWFSHAQIAAGGMFRIEMGERPNERFAAGAPERPPSFARS